MRRYRPPAPRSSKYITPAGAARLRAELDTLWRVERPQVTLAVQAAAAQGDRSENAEYTYGKRRLREIDHRVRFLRKRLEGMTIVDKSPADQKRVYFGARVTLEDAQGIERCYRIVGPDEFDAAPDYISMDAPLARGLLGMRIDEEITVELASGSVSYVITDIAYPREEPSTGPARS